MDSYPQPGEIRFRVGSVPVIIQPYFWLTAVILSSGWFNMEPRPWPVFTFILGVFVSILIHELGHAWAGMFFGARHVFIRLTGMGVLRSSQRARPQADRRRSTEWIHDGAVLRLLTQCMRKSSKLNKKKTKCKT